jgi:hypothetical protein
MVVIFVTAYWQWAWQLAVNASLISLLAFVLLPFSVHGLRVTKIDLLEATHEYSLCERLVRTTKLLAVSDAQHDHVSLPAQWKI